MRRQPVLLLTVAPRTRPTTAPATAAAPADGGDIRLSVPPAGESADVHYQSIGRRTLAQGDALLTTVASGTAEYRRLVQWHIRDAKEAERLRQSHPDAVDDDPNSQPWDVVRFENPLPFPMTTGPAMFLERGHFIAQALSAWTNPKVSRDDSFTDTRRCWTERLDEPNSSPPAVPSDVR